MSKQKAKSYPEEFKQSSAQLSYESEKPISHTAIDLGLSSSTLHTWVNKYYPGHKKSTIAPSSDDIQFELKSLKKELARVKQERDILKKASAYFAKEIL